MRLLQSLLITFFLLFLGICTSLSLFSQEVIVNNEKNYLRIVLQASKNDLEINKEGTFVHVNFFNDEMYQSVVKKLNQLESFKKYIKRITPENKLQLKIELQNPGIELFSFYKEVEKNHIMDLWVNPSSQKESDEKEKIVKENKVPLKKKSIAPEKLLEKNIREVSSIASSNVKIPLKIKKSKEKNRNFYDFRYGASFIWEYKPLLPRLVMPVKIENKTPEYFYPIEDRKYGGEDIIEAHMQAAINFYKEEKYGFMSKSLKIFEDKFSKVKKFDDLVLYLKGNALLRQYMKNGESEYLNTALALLDELAETTHNYELKRGVYQYLINVYFNQGNVIKALESSKKLYVVARSNFDEELVHFSSRVILDSLSKLRQRDKINKFLEEPVVKKFLENQIGIGYKVNVMMDAKSYNEVISLYEKFEDGLQKPVEESLLFNVAESYFQVAEYEKSKDLFRDYIQNYSHLKSSYKARLRYALNLDLLNENRKEVRGAYKKAVDLSADPQIRYEAKLRYVGFEYLRNKRRDKEAPNLLALINYNDEEERVLEGDLKKLLWQVRLRSLIVKESYKEAMGYYLSIPLNTLTYYDREVFEKDFHESLLGRMKGMFEEQKYAGVIKHWELYKEVNLKYQPQDYTMSYYVGLAYLNLGFTNEFIKMLDIFKSEKKRIPIKEYPLWVERDLLKVSYENIMMKKLYIEKKWSDVESLYLSLEGRDNIYLTHKYLVSLYRQEKNKSFIEEVEKIFINDEYRKLEKEDFQSLILNYVVSLRDTKSSKYLVKLKAILKDPYIGELEKLSERLYYILLEEYSKDKARYAKGINEAWEVFKKKYSKSEYYSRAKYIYGSSLLKSLEKKEGEQILQEIISDKSSPSYLKKLAESDLNDLRIKQKI